MQVTGIKESYEIIPSTPGVAAPASEPQGSGSQGTSDTVTISEQAYSALNATSSGTGGQTPEVHTQSIDTPSAGGSDALRTATRVDDGSTGAGETASFSENALDGVAKQVGEDNMTGSKVTATLDDGGGTPTAVTYNNSNGSVTWNGCTLDLSGFANTRSDDVVIKNNNGYIEVYNLSTNKKMTLNANGTKITVGGKVDASSIVDDYSEAANLSTALFINNKGKAAHTGDDNDIIINRQANAAIDAGLGNDKIFNFASTAVTLDGGGGNDSVYTVGVKGTNIDVSQGGNGYVKLLGSMTGGVINLGTGQNYVDARGQTLSGVTIRDSAGAGASAVHAKTITNKSSIILNAARTAIDATTLISSSITLGTGANSLVIDRITGKATDKAAITSSGVNTYKFGTVSHAVIDSSKAVSDAIKLTGNTTDSTFHLGKGNNLLDATGRSLTGVSITSASGGTGSTTIRAASISGRNSGEGMSNISLAGSGTGNVIEVSGAIKNANINTGNGAGRVSAGSLATVNMTMGGAGSSLDQSLTVKGGVSNVTYTGSDGNDDLNILGAVSNARIALGAGTNSFTARNAKGVLQAVTNTDISASGTGSTTLTMGAYKYGSNGNAVNLGSGANTINVGTISGSGTKGLTIDASGATGTQTLNIAGSVNYLTYVGAAGTDNIAVTSTIKNSRFDLGDGVNSLTARNAAGTLQSVTNTNITASGASSSTTLTMGNYSFAAGGNDISLGAGSNNITVGNISGSGANGLRISHENSNQTQTLNINGSANYLTYNGSSGADVIVAAGAVNNSAINLGDGDNNSFTAKNAQGVLQAVNNTNITASGSGSSSLTMGNYTFSASGNAISLGAGANTINIGKVAGKGTNGLTIGMAETTNTQTLNLSGTATYLTYNGTSGADVITAAAGLTNSKIELGGGDNSFTAGNASGVMQNVTNTNITATGTGSSTVTMGSYTYDASGNSISLGSGANTVTLGTVSGKGTNGLSINIADTSETQTLNITGTANYLTYNGTAGADVINVTGIVNNSTFDLGAGDNVFSAAADKSSVTDSTIKADGNGNNAVTINSFVSSKKDSSLTLGNGNDSVTINTMTGKNTQIHMGGGTENSFTAGKVTGGVINGSGGGTYTIDTGSGTRLDFTGNEHDLTLNIQNSLAGSVVDLGNGDTRIGSAGADENAESTASLSGTQINAGSGKLTMDLKDMSSSTVNMNTENAGDTARLDLSVNGTMKGSNVNLGHGENTINANTISGSTITRTQEGSLHLESENVSGSTLDLSKDGSDVINVSGNLDAAISMGAGADSITVGGAVSGSLTTEADLTLNSDKISNLTAELGGNNDISVGTSISGSKINAGAGNTTIKQSGGGSEITLDIKGSTIESSGKLHVEARDVDSSTITILNGDDDKGDLDLKLTGSLQGSTINLGGGDQTINVVSMTNSTINRTENGSLLLETGSVSGGAINLTGEGSDTLNINGDMSAAVTMGKGADKINVAGVMSGKLTTEDDVDVNAQGLSGMNMELTGSNNWLNITGDIKDSALDLGDGRTTLVNTVDYSNTTIKGGNNDYVINANKFEGGSITLGDGNNQINVTDSLSAKVDLGGGANTVGADNTSLNGFSFTGSGSNTIRGKDLVDGSITVGGVGQTNQLLITGVVENASITLNGGANTFGSANTALKNTTISGSGAGANIVEASSMTGGGITLGESDDHVEIHGDIDSVAIDLGEGVNTLRNTNGGSFLNNKVRNSKITLRGNTSVYLGDVREGSSITGQEGNNVIEANKLNNSNIDISAATETGIKLGTVNGDIKAGLNGTIDIVDIQSGTISDEMGRNAITIGTLGERAELETGAKIHSTTIAVDVFDGTMNLRNHNYGGLKSDNLTIGQNPYAGTLNIGTQATTPPDETGTEG